MLILLDQDDVLADWTRAAASAVRAVVPPEVHTAYEDITSYEIEENFPAEYAEAVRGAVREKGFFRNLPVIPGAVQGAHALLAAGHDVFICTSPLDQYEHVVLEKYQWIEEHFGFEWTKRMILTKDKTIVRGDILLDDKPRITGVRTPTWDRILYPAPHNRHVDEPRFTWDDGIEQFFTLAQQFKAARAKML